MSTTDISQLADESLSAGAFPAERKSAFRVYCNSQTHQSILTHAAEDTSVEICGVLVGQWLQDDDGPFAEVSEYIRCDNATQGQAEVTFTHESWNYINSEMDSKFSELRIVGWYHSHPDFGIFLSDRDIFIQEHFFGSPGQVALVVDPVRKLEGVFEWRAGQPTLMDHYWIGDRVQSVAASRTPESTRLVNREKTADNGRGPAGTVAGRRDRLSNITTILSWMCVFLLGWLLSGTLNSSRAYQSWAIERYGLWNIMQLGRNNEIALVRTDMDRIQSDVSALSRQHLEAAGDEQSDELQKRWKETLARLTVSQRNMERLQTLYALSPDEEQLALSAVVDQLARLRDADSRLLVPIPVPERFYPMLMSRMQPVKKASGNVKPEGKPAQPSDAPVSEPKPRDAPRPVGPDGPPAPAGSATGTGKKAG